MTIINSTAVSATFTAPTYNGNSPITSYALIANGAIVGTNTGSPIVATGLSSTNLVFSVAAVNDVGLGKTSDVVYATPSNTPVNLTLPTISGTAFVGQTLSTTNGNWSHNISSYAYQWQRAGANIAAATSSSYTLVSADASNVIRCVVTATSATTANVGSVNTANTSSVVVAGQQAYTTPGTFSWTCPAGVTSVSVVCIGGGSARSDGGAGGGLGYKNNITVTPGVGYTVVVGEGGLSNSTNGWSSSGGNSYFNNISTVRGNGGSATGGTYVGDGGGNGGAAGISIGGGGGAGGYSGAGGAGLTGTGLNSGNAGAGGGGGSGGTGVSSGSWWMGAAGGGTGILGQGANGVGGPQGSFSSVPSTGGGGGSGGANGQSLNDNYAVGGLYGGGGGAQGKSGGVFSGNGASGAVRIIWPGTTRYFPNTNTGNM